MKTVLIVSGGIEAADAARRAKELGYYVVVSDRDPQAPGFAYADSRLIADVYGAAETAAAAERYHRKIRKIDGVLCVAADAPVTAALVAERLGLCGLPVPTAELACDKLAMKTRLSQSGVAVPGFMAVETPQALQRIVVEHGTNLVIKPVDSRGSRGVQRLGKVADIDRAFQFARSHSPTQRVMVEQYLEGPQISTESIIVNGQCHTPGFSDRNYEYLDRFAPYFVENGGDLPSRLPQEIQEQIKTLIADAARALNIDNGTVKGDIVVHKGKPYVIELAARLSGGFFCTREIPLNTGVDFVGAALRLCVGDPVSPDELTAKRQTPVVQRYCFAPAGRVTGIAGDDAARAIAGVVDVVITAKIGDVIPEAGDRRPSAAMVLCTGQTHQAALAAANDALACIRVETA